MWESNNDSIWEFNVKNVWSDLSEINLFWLGINFSQDIPRHSSMLCLAIPLNFKTQDRLASCQMVEITCEKVKDSHSHWLFECDFSLKVWSKLKDLANLDNALIGFRDLFLVLLSLATKKLKMFQEL